MKRSILLWLCVVLSGCTTQDPAEPETKPPEATPPETEFTTDTPGP